VVIVALLLPACSEDGHLCLLGYSTKPNYNTDYHTIRVPIFKNVTFVKDIEFDLTREVCNQINLKTPYRVVGCNEDADTELIGKITIVTKGILNRNQLNEIREAETNLTVELVWRDVRTGKILSKPRERNDLADLRTPGLPAPTLPVGPDGLPLQLSPSGPDKPPGPPPVVVATSLGHFAPEIGQSITTSYQQNVKRLATQIVSLMEDPW
jgi:hypothetical protein